MRKHSLVLVGLVVLAVALMFTIGCNEGGDSPTGPDVAVATSGPAPTTSNDSTQDQPVAAPGDDDASGGRVLWARFKAPVQAPWVAQFFNDTANAGKVAYCVYDASNFGNQGDPIASKVVDVPSGTNYGDIELDIYDVVPEEWCGKVDFQADLIRGGVCGQAPANHGGYNFGAVFGHLERACECVPNEPRIIRVTEEPSDPEEGWGSCSEFPTASDVRFPCEECREVSVTTVTDDGCEERTSVADRIERREIPCPTCEDYTPPEVTLEWEVVTQEDLGGLLAAGHLCNAIYSGVVIKPSICAPPFDITPAFPLLVPWESSQEFTFRYTGTWTTEEMRLQCPISLEKTFTVTVGEKPCKPWYPGSLPAEGAGRITFMSKLPTGEYLWRIQNNTGADSLTVKGPGIERTFEIPSGTIGAFTTASPYYGVSLYLCDGTRVHGTASANENVENWCDYPEATEGECPTGTCFYNLNEVVEGQEACFAAPGYVSWNDQNHLCELLFPGVSLKGWNLNPGQSAEGCLSKLD